MINTQLQILPRIHIDVSLRDLKQKIRTSGDRPDLYEAARKILDTFQGIWKPRAVYQWFQFKHGDGDNCGSVMSSTGIQHMFNFGFASKFLTHAHYVLIAVYTIGRALEIESFKASSNGKLLEAYLLDLLCVVLLEKAGREIKDTAQNQAQSMGWGVGPYMSPGSVHGWELEAQTDISSLLPIEKIDVSIQDNSVLSPFKTLSCLIGIGPDYESTVVGTTCQICPKNNDCQFYDPLRDSQ